MKYYARVVTKQFKKDLRRLKRASADLSRLEDAIDILASGSKLPAKYRDHKLSGKLQGTRECHIGPDWLLLYEKNNDELILILISTGDHRHVLNIE